MGRKKLPKNQQTKFTLPYQAGELTAVVYDAAGKETARTSLVTAGDETELRLLPEKDVLQKGDLLYVHLRYTDKNGTVKPVVRGKIDVEVQGGKLLALGNACSYNPVGYQVTSTDTYYGEALAIIEPLGDVTVKAKSPYGDATLTI